MISRRSAGFTLIEVLIVVVIMAILAGAIIPKMSTSTTDAKESLLRDNLRTLRMQIEMYKAQHFNKAPVSLIAQLTSATDAAGNTSDDTLVDATHPYGPYLKKMPAQPFSGLISVRLIGSSGTPTGVAAPGAGWMYQSSSGRIWADHAAYQSW